MNSKHEELLQPATGCHNQQGQTVSTNIKHEELLRQVCEETFMAMAFLSPVDRDECPATDLDSLPVSVEFTGQFNGRLTLKVSRQIPAILAANVLGLDDGDAPSPDQQADALKETLNVICGNILPLVSDATQVFNVHAPQMLDAGPATPAQARPDASVLLYTDSGSAEVLLWLDDAIAAT